MWKTGLLAAAVGVATLVATILIGRPLVEPEDAPEPAAVATAPVRSWAERASAHCRDAVGSVRAEISGATGLTTAPERAVQLFSVTTEIEGRLLRFLRALRPAAGQRARVAKALDLLERQYKQDLVTAGKLAQRYDVALLTREVLAYERVAAQLRVVFRDLGAQGCVAYFDPETYR